MLAKAEWFGNVGSSPIISNLTWTFMKYESTINRKVQFEHISRFRKQKPEQIET